MIRVITLLLVTLPWSTLAAEPIKIGNDIQLFGDSSLIESHVNFHRKYHTPTPKEVSLTTDKPWEGNVSAYFTFLQDGDQYRAYYRGSHYDTTRKIVTHREVTCVATSKDGIHWEKPELGIWEFAGSKRTTSSGTALESTVLRHLLMRIQHVLLLNDTKPFLVVYMSKETSQFPSVKRVYGDSMSSRHLTD